MNNIARFFTFAAIFMISACASNKPQPAPQPVVTEQYGTLYKIDESETLYKYTSDNERFKNNILVKNATPTEVTYEYKDVRIDEIGLLASRYCNEKGSYGAILREAGMYKNFSRRATFDCVVLQ